MRRHCLTWSDERTSKNSVVYVFLSCSVDDNSLVCDLDIAVFVLILSTEQWSCFPTMMLWWSGCSAGTVVLMQWTGNAKSSYTIVWKSSSKLLWLLLTRLCLILHTTSSSQSECITNGKEVNAVENASTHAHTSSVAYCWSAFIVDHMWIVWAWMLVTELHQEQECIYFLDVGWFCFVSMKQRISLYTYIFLYVYKR